MLNILHTGVSVCSHSILRTEEKNSTSWISDVLWKEVPATSTFFSFPVWKAVSPLASCLIQCEESFVMPWEWAVQRYYRTVMQNCNKSWSDLKSSIDAISITPTGPHPPHPTPQLLLWMDDMIICAAAREEAHFYSWDWRSINILPKCHCQYMWFPSSLILSLVQTIRTVSHSETEVNLEKSVQAILSTGYRTGYRNKEKC